MFFTYANMGKIDEDEQNDSYRRLSQNEGNDTLANYGSCELNVDIAASGHIENGFQVSSRERNYRVPKRYIFSMLCFTACCLSASHNMDLSIAIVSMIQLQGNDTSMTTKLQSNTQDYEKVLNTSNEESLKVDWNGQTVGIILGAVNYGHLIAYLPGGRLAELYGGKQVLIFSMLLTAIATLLSPVTAIWSPYAFFITRLIAGIGTGPTSPIVNYMLGKWIPEQESNFQLSIILSGYSFGSFFALSFAGALCGSSFMGGWPSVFYVGAVCTILWSIACALLMSESPEVHGSISGEELQYIVQNRCLKNKENIAKIPWKAIMFSLPFWALAVGYFGQFWLLGFFSTVQPLYMATILNISVEENGILSSLPHLLRSFAAIMASFLVDFILAKKFVSTGFVRKGATILNSVAACAAFFGITFVGNNVLATTVLFILAGLFGEFISFGVCIACIDIAPNLSGTVSGIINIFGMFPFFIIPALVAWITNYEESYEAWQCVFYISIFVVAICTGFFTLFGNLNPQPWGTATIDEHANNNRRTSDQVTEVKRRRRPTVS
nr:sialin [Parasteatoda tepidariorum]